MYKYDILLVAVPIDSFDTRPLPAIFHLKSYLEQNGFNVKCIEGQNMIEYHGLPYEDLIGEIKYYADRSKWIGLSMLTDYQVPTAVQLFDDAGLDPSRVLWGGNGTAYIKRKLAEGDTGITARCRHVFYGEGEHSLLEFISGNPHYPGINSDPIQIDDISSLPPPDYSGLELPMIALTGSRGCVRACKFCNVPLLWQKYRYVDGEVLANNAIYATRNTNTKHIAFSDSLINGSVKEFKKMCTRLAEYNSTADEPVTWEAQYVIRRCEPDHYRMVVDSGCTMLKIGIETGSEQLRAEMNKKFSNKDMLDVLRGFMEVDDNFKLVLMLVMGYPAESRDDFELTLDLVEELAPYHNRIKLSPTMMSVMRDTPVYVEHPELLENVESELYDEFTFINTNGKFEDRLVRYIKFETMLKYHRFCYEPSIANRKPHLMKIVDHLDLDYNTLYIRAMRELIDGGRIPESTGILNTELDWDYSITF